jgi:hypothetical protein
MQELIGLGAKTIVVPGNFPIGCSPGYLAKFVRLRWLPQVGEQPGHAPQQRAQGGAGQTQPAAPRRRRPLRRLLRRRHDPHRRPAQARVRRRSAGVVLRRRRAVQRRLGGTVQATACRDPYMAVSRDGFHYAYKLIADAVLPEARSHHRH